MPEPMVTMRPPSPISFDAARIAVTTPWTLMASWRASAAVSALGSSTAPLDRDAGIVDENVEPAEMLCDVLHQLLDLGGRRLVGLEGAGFDALGLQFGDDGFRLVGRGDIADGDVGAFVGERAGAGCADAARAAGDEGNLA